MCRAMQPNKIKIGGCLALLQLWVWFRYPFLRPRVNHLYTFPLVTRWSHSPSYRGIPTALEDIRLLLDQRSEAHVKSACDPDYMPWFRIHGKPYLLSEEERRRQIYAKRERRGPLNPRTRGGEAGLSTAPTQSSAPTEQATMPTPQPLQIML
ncbi:hypothetical protein Gotur_004767, partial [Gossypium turneri]